MNDRDSDFQREYYSPKDMSGSTWRMDVPCWGPYNEKIQSFIRGH